VPVPKEEARDVADDDDQCVSVRRGGCHRCLALLHCPERRGWRSSCSSRPL